MAFGASFLKSTTVLEQLLEEINFQRTKEMRQLLKDESGFVVLQGTTYWTDLFVRHFLFQEERSIDCDDLLFFVRKRHVKGSSRYLPKYETEVEVFRKDSKKLPIGDPDIDWEETVYLNLIIHQFDYTLTLAVCTRTSPKELQVLKRHSQKVYASPSRRNMHTKGDGEEITYPHICFMVDNFDEVFGDMVARDGEMVCVELVAGDRTGAVRAVIFLGSIRYDALASVYDSRQSSLGSKVAQRMSFGLLSGGNSNSAAARCEFVRMKGPQGKGHAEMAVSRPHGCGADTPSSEPGTCAIDAWDSDWEDDPEDFYENRHKRRLSDPSSNINNFCRTNWRTRAGYDSSRDKSRSENEGLDSMVDGIAEIQAGDLRDDERRRSGHTSSPRCWTRSACCAHAHEPCDMAEVYRHGEASANSTPACLHNVTAKRSTRLLKPSSPGKNITSSRKEIKVDSTTLQAKYKPSPKYISTSKDKIKSTSECNIKTKPASPRKLFARKNRDKNPEPKSTGTPKKEKRKTVKEEYEIADDVVSMNEDEFSKDDGREKYEGIDESVGCCKMGMLSDLDPTSVINVNGREELPCVCCEVSEDAKGVDGVVGVESIEGAKGFEGVESVWGVRCMGRRATLPRARGRGPRLPPQRTTADGTDIFYWCDVPNKKKQNELDDGAYNPLWATRGFTQTFHLWKEGKRQQSAPINAYLTYVTLPWWSIAKDILDHREEPILTF